MYYVVVARSIVQVWNESKQKWQNSAKKILGYVKGFSLRIKIMSCSDGLIYVRSSMFDCLNLKYGFRVQLPKDEQDWVSLMFEKLNSSLFDE